MKENTGWQHELSPEELIVLKGMITDHEFDALCGNSKTVRRWAARRFKCVGATYNRGHSHLYGSWSFGLCDLHWHPIDAKLGGLSQSPEEMYRGLLMEASDHLVKQSLAHETALMKSGAQNWVKLITEEMDRRKKKVEHK